MSESDQSWTPKVFPIEYETLNGNQFDMEKIKVTVNVRFATPDDEKSYEDTENKHIQPLVRNYVFQQNKTEDFTFPSSEFQDLLDRPKKDAEFLEKYKNSIKVGQIEVWLTDDEFTKYNSDKIFRRIIDDKLKQNESNFASSYETLDRKEKNYIPEKEINLAMTQAENEAKTNDAKKKKDEESAKKQEELDAQMKEIQTMSGAEYFKKIKDANDNLKTGNQIHHLIRMLISRSKVDDAKLNSDGNYNYYLTVRKPLKDGKEQKYNKNNDLSVSDENWNKYGALYIDRYFYDDHEVIGKIKKEREGAIISEGFNNFTNKVGNMFKKTGGKRRSRKRNQKKTKRNQKKRVHRKSRKN
jgi:hypothetical protein